MRTSFAKQLIALLETNQCAGYQTDVSEDGKQVRVNVTFSFTGAEARTMNAYSQRKVREAEREFRRDRPQTRKLLAEVEAKAKA